MAWTMLALPGEQMSAKLIRVGPIELPRRPASEWAAGLALVLGVVVVLLLWGWSRGSDARTLARLPPVERARLFELTRLKAEALCAAPDLEDGCRAEVELLSKFPECETECQAFVAGHRPGPVR